MAERKSFLLRLPAELLDELQRWSQDDLRSLNAQIEYLLREQVRRRRSAGSEVAGAAPTGTTAGADGSTADAPESGRLPKSTN